MNADTSEATPEPRRSRFFGWRFVRRSTLVVAVLVTLAALVYSVVNWRGARAWNAFRQEWKAKGEPFDLAAIMPKPVSDPDNFAMTPLLKPLLDYAMDPVGKTNRWRDEAGRQRALSILAFGSVGPKREGHWQIQEAWDMTALQAHYRGQKEFPHFDTPGRPGADILKALSRYDREMAEIRTALGRPACRFPVHYEENMACLLPHLAVLKNLARVALVKSLAYLDLGETDVAMAEFRLGLRLAETLRDEPVLISQLVRMAIHGMAVQVVWEGMAQSRWTASQLVMLEKALRGVQVLESFRPTLRAERVFSTELIEMMRRDPTLIRSLGSDSGKDTDDAWWESVGFRLLPSGCFHQNKLLLSRLHLEGLQAVVDGGSPRVYPERLSALGTEIDRQLQRSSLNSFLVAMLLPALSNVGERFAASQTALDLAVGAAVLEQHRLETGAYPDSLEALPATARERIPRDLVTGELLRYARQANGRFQLYSVGWNQKDDGGKPGLRAKAKDRQWDRRMGDWVWAYSEGRRQNAEGRTEN